MSEKRIMQIINFRLSKKLSLVEDNFSIGNKGQKGGVLSTL